MSYESIFWDTSSEDMNEIPGTDSLNNRSVDMDEVGRWADCVYQSRLIPDFSNLFP